MRKLRAAFGIMEPVGHARDFMQAMLRGKLGGHGELQAMFGGDCLRIANMRVFVEQVIGLLQGWGIVQDVRLKSCLDTCEAVESVLRDLGFSMRLAEAKLKTRAAVLPTLNSLEAHPALPRTTSQQCVRLAEVERLDRPLGEVHPAPPLTTSQLLVCAAEVESLDRCQMILDELFDALDHDADGVLEGFEFDKAVNELTDFVLLSGQKRRSNLGRNFSPPERVVRKWVAECIDPRGTGAVTREDARGSFKVVVDDIQCGMGYHAKASRLIRTSLSKAY